MLNECRFRRKSCEVNMSIWLTWVLLIPIGWLIGATEKCSCEGEIAYYNYTPLMYIHVVATQFCMHLVAVSTPWEKTTYVPQNSVIYINCTDKEGQDPFWSLRFLESDNFINFVFPSSSKNILNSRGFYEIPQDGANSETIQLVINGTDGNNNTSIRCIESSNLATLFETALHVYGIYWLTLLMVLLHVILVHINFCVMQNQ